MRHLTDVFVGVAVMVFTLWAYVTQAHTVTYTAEVETPVVEIIEIEKKVELREELKPICACESVGNRLAEPQHLHPDGTVIRGVINPDDIGMCQINLKYHGETAEEMGIDLFEEEGNITYANWLYEQQGSQPWFWSAGCWQI